MWLQTAGGSRVLTASLGMPFMDIAALFLLL